MKQTTLIEFIITAFVTLFFLLIISIIKSNEQPSNPSEDKTERLMGISSIHGQEQHWTLTD